MSYMTELYFVDTNLLVYARDASEPEKQAAAIGWLDFLWHTKRGRLSSQVLQEYYQVVTRKLSPGLPHDLAREDISDLDTWQPCVTDHQLMTRAWMIEDDFSLSWWDSLIVAAAHRTGAAFLLTEDLQTGQAFGKLQVVDPFQSSPPKD
jgi:predicted nucleic acid-binding protein